MTTTALEQPRNEKPRLARDGLIGMAGSITSATMGFLFTLILARSLGSAGSGVVLQAVAVFTIVLSLARGGMDSAAVWIMPRLAGHSQGLIRGTVSFLLLAAALTGTLGAILTIALAPVFASTGDPQATNVADAVAVAAWFIPAGAVLMVALAITRGLGGVVPYVSVGSIALPVMRPVLVGVVATLGGSFAAVTLAWAAPLPLALLAAVFVLRFQVRRHERLGSMPGPWRAGPWRADAGVRRSVLRYALPRTVSAGLEQSVIWLDVIMVGILAGSAAAGIYGGASRFVAAGLIIDSALRIVVSTRFSVLLFEKKFAEVQSLYRVAATWLVLFSTPIYLVLAIFAPVVLGWLGAGFNQGALPLMILCVGAILTMTAGNIHSVLLMSGRSGWAALNKAIVLVINVGGNILLIPVLGMTGAAVTWAFSMLIDASLAAIEVRVFTGIRIGLPAVLYALMVTTLTVAVPALVLRVTLGPTLSALLGTLAVGAVLFLTWCALDRERLHLTNLSMLTRRHK